MNHRYVYLELILLSVLFKDVLSARILAMMTVPSHSHHLWNSKYIEALLRRGHNVTYVGMETLRSEYQNLQNVAFDKLGEEVFRDVDFTEYADFGPVESILLLDKWDHMLTNAIKRSESFRKFLQLIKTESFDLIVHDVTMTPFMLGAVEILNDPPLIGITPMGQPSWINDLLGNPIVYSSQPHSFLPYMDEMNFTERLTNYLFHMFTRSTRSMYMIEQNKHAKDAFGEQIRPLEETLGRMSIIMVNTNEGLDFPYPKVPGLIPVGGLHIDPPKPLPKNLQSYLDSAEKGVIYFSLGTNIMSSRLKKETVHVLKKAFRLIAPVKVLWKWERDELPDKVENIKFIKWAPQNDILAHPNVVLFFTHSGRLSTQESIYHGVPMLGMPFFLDQNMNIEKCVRRGIAERLTHTSLTSDIVVEKIKKILSDTRYKRNVKRLSELFRDVMESPLERAVFWTEYAIRHGGAQHLTLAARKLPWFQNALLDVYGFILLMVVIVVVVLCRVLRFLAQCLSNNRTKTKTS